VRVVLVNIFAGINRCDWVAQGIVRAAGSVSVQVPVVTRLAGTNVEEGRRILRESGLPIVAADDLADAARQAVLALERGHGTLPNGATRGAA
jgi:succinyl-CoA synthetase beta subunit